ncbi:MAG: chorismate synthase [Bacteroidetes bacterium]|nr:chorismate synthase [Bacteroidota bacterium]
MSSNSFGDIFRITSFGESHGTAVGITIDGVPGNIRINKDLIQAQLDRRRPGQSNLTTSRNEQDRIDIISGMLNDFTTGAPVTILIYNKEKKPEDYSKIKDVFRPSHSDFTYQHKYGIRDPFGGGRSSARVTAGWVAAGAFAEQILEQFTNIKITAWVNSVGSYSLKETPSQLNRQIVDSSLVRCPDVEISNRIIESIEKAKEEGNSLGGIIGCEITGCEPGLGDPVFSKLSSELAHAMFCINAVKGFEIGDGFDISKLKGSEANDEWENSNGQPVTSTNHSGGIQGGISNGMPIHFKVAFKPTSSISSRQKSVNTQLEPVELNITGRHDPCVLPRAVPIVEAMAAIVILNAWLRNRNVNLNPA